MLFSASSEAGGWTQDVGAHYFKLSTRSMLGSSSFAEDGARGAVPAFQDHALNFYGEYGLTPRVTVLALGRPAGLSLTNERSAFYAGELQAGARLGLAQGDWRLSLEARLGGTPSDSADLLAGSGFAARYQPAVASGCGDLEVQLGHAIGARGWITAHAGVRAFTRAGLDPVVTGFAQAGWRFLSGLQLSAMVTVWQPVGAVRETNVPGAGQTRYVGFGADVSYWFNDRWAVTAGISSAFVAQSNAAAAPFTFGIEHRGL